MTQDDRDREQEEEARHAAALEKLWAARKLGGKAMAANGNGGKLGLGQFTWGTLVTVAVLVVCSIGTWFGLASQVDDNANDMREVRTSLKEDYVPRRELTETLKRIEEKVDRISRRLDQ